MNFENFQSFMRELEAINDPLLVGLFNKCKLYTRYPLSPDIVLLCPKEHCFFDDWIKQTCKIWGPLWIEHIRQPLPVFIFTDKYHEIP